MRVRMKTVIVTYFGPLFHNRYKNVVVDRLPDLDPTSFIKVRDLLCRLHEQVVLPPLFTFLLSISHLRGLFC